jgi:hypothetical protein
VQDAFQGGVGSEPCNSGDDGQVWEFFGSSQIKNAHTQKCLQDAFQGGLGSEPCSSFTGQRWIFRSVSGGIQIQNVRTQTCLQDAFQGGPGTVACDNTAPVTPLQLGY